MFAFSYVEIGMVTTTAAAFLLMAFYGLFPALTDGVSKTWVAQLSTPDARGAAMGAYQFAQGTALLFAGLWAGALWYVGAGMGSVPLIAAGIASGFGGLLVVFTDKRMRRLPSAA